VGRVRFWSVIFLSLALVTGLVWFLAATRGNGGPAVDSAEVPGAAWRAPSAALLVPSALGARESLAQAAQVLEPVEALAESAVVEMPGSTQFAQRHSVTGNLEFPYLTPGP